MPSDSGMSDIDHHSEMSDLSFFGNEPSQFGNELYLSMLYKQEMKATRILILAKSSVMRIMRILNSILKSIIFGNELEVIRKRVIYIFNRK